MSQYDIKADKYVERNNRLFDVVLQADENGNLWNRRYSKDAWGRQKSVQDFSMFSATWTYGIPTRIWEEWFYDGTTWSPQIGFTRCDSTNKMLTVYSGTVLNNGTTIASKTHPKYQPNRGHLYSTAIICPNASSMGIRRFGVATPNDGVFFEVVGDGNDWDIFIVRRSYGNIDTRVSIKNNILEKFPTFSPEHGNVYDIQYQWRGVGNYHFYVNLELIYVDDILGSLTRLSMSDPALQAFFACYCGEQGTQIELKSGCVDISSEGGVNPKTAFGNINTGSSLVSLGASNAETAILALKVPRNINSYYNSRGAFLDKLVSWTRDESLTTMYSIRDTQAAHINSIPWSPVPDSHLLFASGGTGGALDTAFQQNKSNAYRLMSEWADIDTKNVVTNDSKNSPMEATPGDIIIVTVKSTGSANAKSSASIYFSDEV